MTVTLVRHDDPNWPIRFDRIRQTLQQRPADSALRIEHVDSTAVPGMVAKPIIDLIVVISTGRFVLVRASLESLGYLREGDLGITGREAFDLHDSNLPQMFSPRHLYVCEATSAELECQLAFRD